MKITNQEISNHVYALNQIANKVKGKLAYAVARNIRKMTNEIIEYEKIKDDTIRKYGEIDENGCSFIMPNTDAYVKFVDEIKEFANIEQEIDIFLVSPEDIYSADLTPNEILSIDFMIEE